MQYFYNALQLLELKLPRTSFLGSLNLVYHTIKQIIRYKFPSRNPPRINQPVVDRARCLAHIGHAYRLQKNSIMGFMTVLKRLNEAEKAQEYLVHEVREIQNYIKVTY